MRILFFLLLLHTGNYFFNFSFSFLVLYPKQVPIPVSFFLSSIFTMHTCRVGKALQQEEYQLPISFLFLC